MKRREFTTAWAYALLGGAALTLTECGGPLTPPEGDAVGAVSDNHGHVAVITRAQLLSAAELTLDIRGGADHTHSITLTMAEVLAVRAGQRLLKRSTAGAGHAHTVTFN